MSGYKNSIKFISIAGEECTFKTEENPLNNNQMWWIEPFNNMFADSLSGVKKVERTIRENCTIISEEVCLKHLQ